MRRLLLAATLVVAMPVLAAPPVALAPTDVKALVAPPAKGVRIVALWALDCAYCEENLSALATWQHQHANVDLVFVATDSIGQRGIGEKVTPRRGLPDDVPGDRRCRSRSGAFHDFMTFHG